MSDEQPEYVPTEDVGRVPDQSAPFASGDHCRALFVDETDHGVTHPVDIVILALLPWGLDWTPADDRGHTLTPWAYVVSLDAL